MAKFDISDGFYHLFLEPNNAPKLAMLMPRYEGEPQLVAVPLSLTLGWVSLPPTFCTTSKTATDIANASLFRHTVPLHHLERTTSTHDCWGTPQKLTAGPQPPFSPPTSNDHMPPSALMVLELVELVWPLLQPEDRPLLMRHRQPVRHVNVFVDDFIGIAQGSWH